MGRSRWEPRVIPSVTPGREKPGDQVVAGPFAGKEWKGRQSLEGQGIQESLRC